ncbi:hypothetical protein A9R05_14645 [Burkholderia sp. KK1]|nr:hypothetical protein A9R05_14645 [Burkholderia sp. KK1]
MRLQPPFTNRTSWRGFPPLFAPSSDIAIAENSSYRKRQDFMAITFVVIQGQRILDALASIVGGSK